MLFMQEVLKYVVVEPHCKVASRFHAKLVHRLV
jgi:hypothetical protein